MTRRWPILIATLALAASACGNDATGGEIASLQGTAAGPAAATTTIAVDPDQAVLDFTQCMREHGIDMPDPQIGSAGGGVIFGFGIAGGEDEAEGPDNAEIQKMTEADEACRHFLEGVVQEFDLPDQSEMEDQMLAFSECMREHGIDMPDPEFSGDGGVTLMGPGEGATGLDPSDPAFQAAEEECQEIFGGGPMTITGGGPDPEGSSDGG